MFKNIVPDSILKKISEKQTDDPIYQIYTKIYRPNTPKINDNFANFYVWMIENYCSKVNELIERFKKIPKYINDNPFYADYYAFNANAFLYNRNKISTIPLEFNDTVMENNIIKMKNAMNRYRIIDEQRSRVMST